MNSYPSYKRIGSEFNQAIPESWVSKKIKYLFSVNKNQISNKEFSNAQVIHYSIPNVQEFGRGILEDGSDIDSSKLVLTGNELLVSRLNPRKCTVCISEENNEYLTVGSGEFIVLKPTHLDIKYCYYQFLTREMTDNLDSLVESVTKSHQRVRPEKVFEQKFIIPPAKDTESIVSFLDSKTQKIDKLIELTQQKIELLKEQRTALINQCVTKGLNPNVEMKDSGVEWIGKIPKSWSMQKLKYLFDYQKGFAFKSSQFIDEGTPIVKASDIKKLTIRESNVFIDSSSANDFRQYSLSENDIILSTVGSKYSVIGSSVGQLAMVSKELDGSLLNQNTVRLKFKSEIAMSISYIFQVLQTRQFRSHLDIHSHGTANQASIDIKDILSFAFWQPLEFEQSQIAAFLDEKAQKIDSTIEKESQRMELLKEYRQSLISEVVTGKIDVRSYEE